MFQNAAPSSSPYIRPSRTAYSREPSLHSPPTVSASRSSRSRTQLVALRTEQPGEKRQRRGENGGDHTELNLPGIHEALLWRAAKIVKDVLAAESKPATALSMWRSDQ